jgi:hypothetical protein
MYSSLLINLRKNAVIRASRGVYGFCESSFATLPSLGGLRERIFEPFSLSLDE